MAVIRKQTNSAWDPNEGSAVPRGIGPTTQPAPSTTVKVTTGSPGETESNPYADTDRRTSPTLPVRPPAPTGPGTASAGDAQSGNRGGVTSSAQQQWDDAWMQSPSAVQTGQSAVARPDQSLGTAVPRPENHPPNYDPNARRAGGTGTVGPTVPPVPPASNATDPGTGGGNNNTTPPANTTFNTQPTANDIQSYYTSRGIAPQGNSLNYWVQKYPELMARGRQLNPSGDGSDYFRKWLSNAEEFTGGPRQTAEAMWGPGAYDRYQASQGIGPSNNVADQSGGGTNDAFTQALIAYLMNQQPQNSPTYNRQSVAPRSDTQIRMGLG